MISGRSGMPVKRRVACVVALLLAAALAVGCSADQEPVQLGDSNTPSPSAEPRPSFATDDPVQALLGWFEAVYQAERVLDPDHPDLKKYGMGGALTDIRQRIASFRAQGVRADKPNVVSDPGISAVGVSKGKPVREVTVCLTEPPNDFVDVKTGKPKAPKEGAQNKGVTSKFTGVMVRLPDGWHIDGGWGEDVDSCDEIR